MAYNLKRGVAAGNAEADAVCALLNNGYLRIYNGTQPASVATAVSDQVLLAELRFNNPACAAGAANAVATIDVDPAVSDSSANASGTPTWFRALESDGSTAVFDGTVGLSGCDCIIDAVPITSGATVTVQSMTYTSNLG